MVHGEKSCTKSNSGVDWISRSDKKQGRSGRIPKLMAMAITLPLLLGLSSANAVDSPAEEALQMNQYGMPVVDASGQPINYSLPELNGMVKQLPQSAIRKHNAVVPASQGAKPVWSYGMFGSGIGKSNIVTAQNGGQLELYMGATATTSFGSNNYWYALRHMPATGEYAHVFVSDFFPSSISRIEVGDVVGGADEEILIATEDGVIHLYDKAGKGRLGEMPTLAGGLEGMAVVDLDGDGANEIVLSTSSHLYVYSGIGTLLWDIASVGGDDLVVAQMDADSGLEIALTDGNVVDASTQSIQWTWPAGFGVDLEAADIDGDSVAELVVAESWYTVWAYDVERQLPKWSISTGDIDAIHLADIDGDSTVELLLGDGQHGDIHVYDTVTLAEKWMVDNPDHGVTDIAVADTDNDGVAELLWGAGASSTGDDHLYVVSSQTQQVEWQNIHLDGPFTGPEMGDVDGDGRDEIVVVSWESDSGYGSGRILVFDPSNPYHPAISGEIVEGRARSGTHDLKLRDVDQDGRLEILVAADRLYDGVIEIYDYDSVGGFTLNWKNIIEPNDATFYSVEAADIDGDGDVEILAGSKRGYGGFESVSIYAYDYNSGNEEWRSLQMGGSSDRISGIDVVDLDQDGDKEIVGMVAGGDTYIFDGTTKLLEAILPGSHTALQITEVGTVPTIVVGDTLGDLTAYQYQAGSYGEIYNKHFVIGSIDGVTVDPRNGGGVWVGSEGVLNRFDLSGAPQWSSADFGADFGSRVVFIPGTTIFLSAGGYSLNAFVDSGAVAP